MKTIEVDFLALSSSEFEELCFDLLVEHGFRRLVWRQGGGDRGRDIQGVRENVSGIVEPFEETWFFECKRYEKGVSHDILSSNIAWADAENLDNLVFIVSSYVTNGAREWISKIANQKPYRIHVVEGKHLQGLVSRSSQLISRYFASNALQLMQEAHRAWLYHYLVPEPELMRTLAETRYLDNYTTPQIAFLWASLKIRLEEVSAQMDNSYEESYDIIFDILKKRADSQKSVLLIRDRWELIQDLEGESDTDPTYNHVLAAQIAYISDDLKMLYLYCFVHSRDGEGLEVLVARDSSLSCSIRYLSSGARLALHDAKERLGIRW